MLSEIFKIECSEEDEMQLAALMICCSKDLREFLELIAEDAGQPIWRMGLALCQLPPLEAKELCAEVLNRAGVEMFGTRLLDENKQLEQLLRA